MSSDLILYKKQCENAHLYNMPSKDVRLLHSANQDKILKTYLDYVENLLLSEEKDNMKKEPHNPYHKKNFEYQKEIYLSSRKTPSFMSGI